MNKSIWNLYKDSERGKKAIDAFSMADEALNTDAEAMNNKLKAIFPYCSAYLYIFRLDDAEEIFIEDFYLIYDSITLDNLLIQKDEITNITQYFGRLIDNMRIGDIIEVQDENNEKSWAIDDKKLWVKQKDYRGICGFIPYISLVLYYFYCGENRFYPILFGERFELLMQIFDALEIPMPNLPANTDKRGRLMLYDALCENIAHFAKENDLNAAEVCACIYDFALMLLDNDDKTATELPEPTNIWFTAGGKEDYKSFMENPIDGTKSSWACNANTKRGDIVVMYICSPYSFIQSVWRADIDGTYTPFNFYNSRTAITKGIVLPHITLNELKADPYFSQLPFVRKNMQGVNGVHFSATDYKELQRLLTAKGFDVSVLPQLYSPSMDFTEILENEKDVEEKLLIPLLQKLGYADTDYTRQLSQKAGRKEKAIPDFVFLPKGEVHFQNAPLIIEAKYDMSSALERTKAYNQALSYARMMQSALFGICDKERLLIYKARNGVFNRTKPAFEKHWQSLGDKDIFRQLKLLVGREVIEKM